mmetsp:Transcript_33473/g.76494  ORF Transcript_33473/g.76494 Transcript_33473/m.76494 type:complete len:170 (-) Transcript_33473:846-1355(-)
MRLEEALRINPGVVRLIRLLMAVLLLAHISACLWFFTTTFDRDTNWAFETNKAHGQLLMQPTSYQYLVSVYFAITTMTTVGYGDITPVTEVEYLFCIFQMLVGASLFAYVVGNMASLLGNIDSASTQLKEKLESVTEFMRKHRLPLELRNRVKQYYHFSLPGSPDRDVS